MFEIRLVLLVRVRQEEPAYHCRMRERKVHQTDRRRNALHNEQVYPPLRSYHLKKYFLRKYYIHHTHLVKIYQFVTIIRHFNLIYVYGSRIILCHVSSTFPCTFFDYLITIIHCTSMLPHPCIYKNNLIHSFSCIKYKYFLQ